MTMCHPSHATFDVSRPGVRRWTDHAHSAGGRKNDQCDEDSRWSLYFGDRLRYDSQSAKQSTGARPGSGPVVVWNSTKTCNLTCVHCYADAEIKRFAGELSTEEAQRMIEDLANFNVPALLISGGEPLVRPDILDLADYATSLGVRVTFSTNGTLINKRKQNVSRRSA